MATLDTVDYVVVLTGAIDDILKTRSDLETEVKRINEESL